MHCPRWVLRGLRAVRCCVAYSIACPQCSGPCQDGIHDALLAAALWSAAQQNWHLAPHKKSARPASALARARSLPECSEEAPQKARCSMFAHHDKSPASASHLVLLHPVESHRCSIYLRLSITVTCSRWQALAALHGLASSIANTACELFSTGGGITVDFDHWYTLPT